MEANRLSSVNPIQPAWDFPNLGAGRDGDEGDTWGMGVSHEGASFLSSLAFSPWFLVLFLFRSGIYKVLTQPREQCAR